MIDRIYFSGVPSTTDHQVIELHALSSATKGIKRLAHLRWRGASRCANPGRSRVAGLTLDAGALIAYERGEERVRGGLNDHRIAAALQNMTALAGKPDRVNVTRYSTILGCHQCGF